MHVFLWFLVNGFLIPYVWTYPNGIFFGFENELNNFMGISFWEVYMLLETVLVCMCIYAGEW